MREIFLEEAREVVATTASPRWPTCRRRHRRRRPADHAAPRVPHAQGQLAHGRAAVNSARPPGHVNSSTTATSPTSTRPRRRCSTSPAGALNVLGDWVEDIAARRDGAPAPPAEIKARCFRSARANPSRRADASDIALPLTAGALRADAGAHVRALVSAPPAPLAPLAPAPLQPMTSSTSRSSTSGAPATIPAPIEIELNQAFSTPAAPAPALPEVQGTVVRELRPSARSDTPAKDAPARPSRIRCRWTSARRRCSLTVRSRPAPPRPSRCRCPETSEHGELPASIRFPMRSTSTSAATAPPPPPRRSNQPRSAPVAPTPAEPRNPSRFPICPVAQDEHVKVVGPLRISIPLFNIYLNEADELSRRLDTEVAEWALELHRPSANCRSRWRIRWPAVRPRSASPLCRTWPARSNTRTCVRSPSATARRGGPALRRRRRGDPPPAAPVRRRFPEGAAARAHARLAAHEIKSAPPPGGGHRRRRTRCRRPRPEPASPSPSPGPPTSFVRTTAPTRRPERLSARGHRLLADRL